ncbi:maleylpyruvate isomerase family mycothiol-dependent enzyme [Pseudonocardia endophytica]|uniref:Maleylpyruvate isomerase n=1 Tax=Pseudonocardia endophytica TaxID=401976 RepID=A0A4R1HMA3_PSEEN|nr:maleylpyruvate isomerase family mycothiol-dependent enzyme [Pseudonocardia endophytica]TCK21675.1 maleylpyruvate isomerase [Pseudonocardia endophytica]
MSAALRLPDRADSLAWAGDGAAHLRGLMVRMGDEAFRAPSLLPGWTRAHVLTHVARNADAMINLVTWAKTGEPTLAYPSRAGRDGDIEAGAMRSPEEIRADVLDSSDRLADAVRSMPEQAWSTVVETPQGIRLPATMIPWGRAREVWIHAVDLDVGASFADMPQPMLTVLVADVGAHMSTRDGCPHVLLEASDTGEIVEIGPGPGGGDVGTVRGAAPDLAAWLLGRTKGTGLRGPDGKKPGPLPAWL